MPEGSRIEECALPSIGSLAGKAVLVTGASSGIGRDTASFLSTLGARLVLLARSVEKLEDTRACLQGTGHEIIPFDLNDLDSIPDMVRSAALKVGGLFGLVHSAGIRSNEPVRVLKAASAEQAFRVNVIAAAFLAKGFRQRGVASAGGSIVLVSSVAGLRGTPGAAIYSSTKAALNGLCLTLAAELAPEGIRVNCVAPGNVETEITDRLRSALTPEQFARIEAHHPLGIGQPRHVSHAIAFLLGEGACWITGSTLLVDGGYSTY
jgi:NAD(P)-dependent dehydrogenase (short-subunit alcohol dehydrogenase family)